MRGKEATYQNSTGIRVQHKFGSGSRSGSRLKSRSKLRSKSESGSKIPSPWCRVRDPEMGKKHDKDVREGSMKQRKGNMEQDKNVQDRKSKEEVEKSWAHHPPPQVVLPCLDLFLSSQRTFFGDERNTPPKRRSFPPKLSVSPGTVFQEFVQNSQARRPKKMPTPFDRPEFRDKPSISHHGGAGSEDWAPLGMRTQPLDASTPNPVQKKLVLVVWGLDANYPRTKEYPDHCHSRLSSATSRVVEPSPPFLTVTGCSPCTDQSTVWLAHPRLNMWTAPEGAFALRIVTRPPPPSASLATPPSKARRSELMSEVGKESSSPKTKEPQRAGFERRMINVELGLRLIPRHLASESPNEQPAFALPRRDKGPKPPPPRPTPVQSSPGKEYGTV